MNLIASQTISRPVFCYTQSPRKSGECCKNINGTEAQTLSMPKSAELVPPLIVTWLTKAQSFNHRPDLPLVHCSLQKKLRQLDWNRAP